MARKSNNGATSSNGATLGFEAKLWQTGDALRNNIDAAEYKHVVLGFIFLKYISDAFEANHAWQRLFRARRGGQRGAASLRIGNGICSLEMYL